MSVLIIDNNAPTNTANAVKRLMINNFKFDSHSDVANNLPKNIIYTGDCTIKTIVKGLYI